MHSYINTSHDVATCKVDLSIIEPFEIGIKNKHHRNPHFNTSKSSNIGRFEQG